MNSIKKTGQARGFASVQYAVLRREQLQDCTYSVRHPLRLRLRVMQEIPWTYSSMLLSRKVGDCG